MKKTLLSSALITVTGMASFGQISIGQWDVALPGKVLHQANDTLSSLTSGYISPGSAGASQTWNFSALGAHVVDTMTFTSPLWLPNGSSFPNANLAILNSSDGSELYLQRNATGLFVEGAYGDPFGQGAMAVPFNPAEQLIKFTDTYNTSFQNTSSAQGQFALTALPGVDSVRFKHTVNKDVLTDGWGNITTPLGTYASLRHKGRVITSDTVWLHVIAPPQWVDAGPPYTTTDTTWHFSWWASGVGFPLLEFDSTHADTIRNVVWLKTAPFIGGINETANASGVASYPNPAVDQIHFEINNQDISFVELFDLSGKKILSLPAKNSRTITYNTESLSGGTYFYRAIDASGTMLGRGKFEVRK